MEYIVLAIVTLAGLSFLLLPVLRGGSIGSGKDLFSLEESLKKKRSDELKDQIESIKLSLKDMDLEHKIGKIADGDFSILKNELLDEWKNTEALYQEALKKEENSK